MTQPVPSDFASLIDSLKRSQAALVTLTAEIDDAHQTIEDLTGQLAEAQAELAEMRSAWKTPEVQPVTDVPPADAVDMS